ncbi:MATE family efflux transporter, partial [Romboutsia ilealis]|nr:MATE family efflux transporter [Romboutsia ilealis]
MKQYNTKMDLLGSAPVSKALFALGLPTMIGMMVNALYNLVDAYFVGGLGTTQMGAITVAYPLGQVVVGLGLLFGNGAASYLSRLLGRGEKEAADKTASTAIYSSIFVGAAVIIC